MAGVGKSKTIKLKGLFAVFREKENVSFRCAAQKRIRAGRQNDIKNRAEPVKNSHYGAPSIAETSFLRDQNILDKVCRTAILDAASSCETYRKEKSYEDQTFWT